MDGNSADGVRLSLQEEFSQIFVFNLRGGVRGKMGDATKREGGNVFPIMTGVAITVLVKDPEHSGTADIFYAEVQDYATRQEKLDQIGAYGSIEGSAGQTHSVPSHRTSTATGSAPATNASRPSKRLEARH